MIKPLACRVAALLVGLSAPAYAVPLLSVTAPGTSSFTVPTTGNYALTAAGGHGGACVSKIGGKSELVTGIFALNAGDILTVGVGTPGTDGSTTGGTGGSPSFFLDNGVPLLVAGGGGGAASGVPGLDALLTPGTLGVAGGQGGTGANGVPGAGGAPVDTGLDPSISLLDPLTSPFVQIDAVLPEPMGLGVLISGVIGLGAAARRRARRTPPIT